MSDGNLESAGKELQGVLDTRRRYRRRATAAVVMCLTLGGGWLVTATWGVRDVSSFAHRAMLAALDAPDRDLQRLDFDPDIPPHREKKMPWYFVGNASSSCPFIVAIDGAYAVGPTAGQRSRNYVFWFFGIKMPIYQSVDWMS